MTRNINYFIIKVMILFIFGFIISRLSLISVNATGVDNTSIESEQETESSVTTETITLNDNKVAGLATYYDAESDSDTVKDTMEEFNELEIKENLITTYKNLGIVSVKGNNKLNIREKANSTAKVIARVGKDVGLDILKKSDDEKWLYIQSGKVKGWVSEEYILTDEDALNKAVSVSIPYAKVKTDGANLNVRKTASKESNVLTQLEDGDKVKIKDQNTYGWIKIIYEEGKTGYISAEYAEVKYLLEEAEFLPEPPKQKSTTSNNNNNNSSKSSQKSTNNSKSNNNSGSSSNNSSNSSYSSTGELLISYAKQFVGNPYVWGGTSLTNGADCSGYVLSVFAQYGYSLPHSSSAQSNYGYSVSLDTGSLRKGDLIFYGSPISHVAIYIGNGQIVHAANSRKGIIISDMYYMSPVKARRILN